MASRTIATRHFFFPAVLSLAVLILTPADGRAAQGDCAQPVSTGAGPVASDCLFILNVAVGTVLSQ